MLTRFELSAEQIQDLTIAAARPGNPGIATSQFSAKIAIPDYASAVVRHFGTMPEQIGAPPAFRHFGLIVRFNAPTRVELYDESRTLPDGLRRVLAAFGPLLFRNAVSAVPDEEPQRNIFPSLRFHVDRAPPQEEVYSLFYRDPSDPVQHHPRKSSTLFIDNAVGLLQGRKEGLSPARVLSSCNLFLDEPIEPLLGRIILEQRWDAPNGTGEIAVLDNRTLLHASFYKHDGGYPISVRYLR